MKRPPSSLNLDVTSAARRGAARHLRRLRLGFFLSSESSESLMSVKRLKAGRLWPSRRLGLPERPAGKKLDERERESHKPDMMNLIKNLASNNNNNLGVIQQLFKSGYGNLESLFSETRGLHFITLSLSTAIAYYCRWRHERLHIGP